jgi:hypothetical protein
MFSTQFGPNCHKIAISKSTDRWIPKLYEKVPMRPFLMLPVSSHTLLVLELESAVL